MIVNFISFVAYAIIALVSQGCKLNWVSLAVFLHISYLLL